MGRWFNRSGFWFFLRRRWWPDEPVIRREEFEEMGLGGFGEVEDFDAPGPTFPELLEGFNFVLDVLDVPSPFPGEVDVEAFSVVHPAGPGLVDAAAEREPVSLRVGDDTHLFVVDASNGDGFTLAVGGHGNFDVQGLVGHHPG